MNMTTMTKFLALMPLVVLGAACGGSSPVAPSNPVATDEGLASAPNASASTKSADLVDPCRRISAVNLEVVPSTTNGTVVEATYVRFSGSSARCAAPIWSSDPRGALTSQSNRFRVAVSAGRPVTVTAMAPNGVKGSLTLGGKLADLNASATVCQGVTGVSVTLVPATTFGGVVVEAKYLGFGPMSSCPAPVWSSVPRGALTPQLNVFRVGVNSPNHDVTVIATTRSGIRGQIRLKRA